MRSISSCRSMLSTKSSMAPPSLPFCEEWKQADAEAPARSGCVGAHSSDRSCFASTAAADSGDPAVDLLIGDLLRYDVVQIQGAGSIAGFHAQTTVGAFLVGDLPIVVFGLGIAEKVLAAVRIFPS